MNPLGLKLKVAIAAAVAITLAIGSFGAGWFVNGALKDAQISELKERQATERAGEADKALKQFAATAAKIRAAADELGGIRKNLRTQIAALNLELDHAPPLPADCLPDTVRVRTLDAAIDAANAAILGQRSGGALPDD